MISSLKTTDIIFRDEIKESYLQVNKEFFEEMLDKLSSYLMKYGINEKGEINYIGYDIEWIIDLYMMKNKSSNIPPKKISNPKVL